ncbi:MAG: glycosyltransferase [Candidatus Hodarchaeota archaeon]
MKVLVVTNMYPTDDDPSRGCFVKEQIDSILERGVDCDTYFIKGRESRWNYIRAIWPIFKASISGGYDLIHAHYGLSAIPARVQWKLPLIISFCGDDILGSPKKNGHPTKLSLFICLISRILARQSAGVIVKSKEMLKKVPDSCSTKIIPNGVDFDLFKPIPKQKARSQLGLESTKNYILFANDPKIIVKRFQLAKKAVDILCNDFKKCELLTIFGKRREEVCLYMNASDCLVLTSFHEGSPNVIKEAMACNLPIVSVDVGDVKEIINGTENCYISKGDPLEIAQSVTKILSNGGRSNGRQHISSLEISKVAQKVIQHYEAILEKYHNSKK